MKITHLVCLVLLALMASNGASAEWIEKEKLYGNHQKGCKDLGRIRDDVETLEKCQKKCLDFNGPDNEKCTALNYQYKKNDNQFDDCILRACDYPIPEPANTQTNYKGYYWSKNSDVEDNEDAPDRHCGKKNVGCSTDEDCAACGDNWSCGADNKCFCNIECESHEQCAGCGDADGNWGCYPNCKNEMSFNFDCVYAKGYCTSLPSWLF